MQATQPDIVLDRDQLRDVTLNDEELMREILSVLIDDTSRQIQLLDAAIRKEDSLACKRLAHYSKGACANVGANSAAALFKHIEQVAGTGNFAECSISLSTLVSEMEKLRTEVAGM